MNDTIAVAVIGFAGTAVGAVASYMYKSKKQAIEDAEREQKQTDQHEQIVRELGQISKRLDEHNGYAEKFAQTAITLTALTKDVEYIKEKLK